MHTCKNLGKSLWKLGVWAAQWNPAQGKGHSHELWSMEWKINFEIFLIHLPSQAEIPIKIYEKIIEGF